MQQHKQPPRSDTPRPGSGGLAAARGGRGPGPPTRTPAVRGSVLWPLLSVAPTSSVWSSCELCTFRVPCPHLHWGRGLPPVATPGRTHRCLVGSRLQRPLRSGGGQWLRTLHTCSSLPTLTLSAHGSSETSEVLPQWPSGGQLCLPSVLEPLECHRSQAPWPPPASAPLALSKAETLNKKSVVTRISTCHLPKFSEHQSHWFSPAV